MRVLAVVCMLVVTSYCQDEFDGYSQHYGHGEYSLNDYQYGLSDEFDNDAYPSAPPLSPPKRRPFTLVASQSLQDFTFDLMSKMPDANASQNLVLSPLSLYTALAMLRPGLSGQSLAQVNAAMRLEDDVSSDDLTEMYTTLFERTRKYKLTCANRVYVDRSVRLKKKYKKEVTSLNATQARRIDISGSTEVARQKINKYVRKRTRKLIDEILPVGSLANDARLLLVNALYLKASWKIGFDLSKTRSRKFWLTPHRFIHVPTMYNKEYQCTMHADDVINSDVTVLSLADSISMMMIMPREAGNFSSLYDNADGTMVEKVGNIINQIWQDRNRGKREIEMCQITMPKFKMEYDVRDMTSVLRRMGVNDVFDAEHADLSRMSNFEHLHVQDIRHKAKLRATEQGVEAAGSTVMSVGIRSVVTRVQKVNKPFLYLLRHDATGAILFAGKVVNPIG